MSAEIVKKIRNDILLCAGIIIVAIVTFLIFKATMKEGSYAVVTIDGAEKYRYNLSQEGSHLIKNGEFENLLVIKNGEALVTTANCRDKICVSHRAISSTGETIVCLPHKLVVSIETEGD